MRCNRGRLVAALAATLFAASAARAASEASLPEELARALRAANVPLSAVSILVQEVGPKKTVLRHNEHAARNPASLMKLFTTLAALELLGPAYRWRTEVYVDGPLKDGVLAGSLALRGGGDPKLDLESFWMVLRALRERGLREVRGDLLIDRGFFAPEASDPGQFDGDRFRPYNVLPDALLVNYRSLRFAFLPDPQAGAVRIAVEPRPPALEVENALRLSEGACPEGRAFRELLAPVFEPSRQRIAFGGRYPASCGERELAVALLAPDDHVAGVFQQLWSELGGGWTGRAREAAVPAGARLFYAHESPPLAQIVRDVNKHSNNVMARHLFLTIGAAHTGAPARADAAAQALREWLAARGIAAPELVLENGSGLSRLERASAATLAALLQLAWRSPAMPEFVSSLPVVAHDGTMRRRLQNATVAGRAHVKTGLLAGVRAAAGYVLDRRGARWVVVMIVNHPKAVETEPAFDALLRWVHGG